MYAKIEVVSYLPDLAKLVTEESCTVGDVYAPISHRFWRRARRLADACLSAPVNMDTVRV
jgi:hypothetical protein